MRQEHEVTHPTLVKLRELVATLPETEERETWNHPTFRVRNKIVTGFGATSDGRFTMSVKQTPVAQSALIQQPGITVAKYVGQHGWVTLDVGVVAWPMIRELVIESYRLVAPKTLVKRLDAGAPPA